MFSQTVKAVLLASFGTYNIKLPSTIFILTLLPKKNITFYNKRCFKIITAQEN